MKILLTAALAALCLTSVRAADNGLTPEEKEQGWKLLFDGKSTSAWRGYAEASFPDHGWVTEDGALKTIITSKKQGGNGGDLVTKEKFTDFDFKFDWKISPAGNSGVKYCVHEGKTGHSGVGYEYQILDDAGNEDGKIGPIRQAGALYLLKEPDKSKHLNPVGEWNSSEIIVRGKHGEHWLNGSRIVEFEMESPEIKKAIAGSKFRNISGYGNKIPTVLLLQDHGSVVGFRNLKVRRLDPSK